MGLAEKAQEVEISFRNQAIARALSQVHRAESRADAEGQASSEICWECGEEIPEARRQAQPGCTLCAKCKSKQEYVPGGIR
jgi:phage/conjugal plasmid C-4 type zinc finger TraR family protein